MDEAVNCCCAGDNQALRDKAGDGLILEAMVVVVVVDIG